MIPVNSWQIIQVFVELGVSIRSAFSHWLSLFIIFWIYLTASFDYFYCFHDLNPSIGLFHIFESFFLFLYSGCGINGTFWRGLSMSGLRCLVIFPLIWKLFSYDIGNDFFSGNLRWGINTLCVFLWVVLLSESGSAFSLLQMVLVRT